jgi:serine/threonine-protein kinase
MGAVFRARHLLINREVAIKLLRLDRCGQEHARAWFIREARAVNRVNHPNIIDIYDFGETEDGLAYLVMELLQGAPLTRAIECGPILIPTALDIVEQIARALARAHDLGVIHRDLKPDNVFLLDRPGRSSFVKIIDFGLARLISEAPLEAKGAVFGSHGYRSPEQGRGEDAGPQSDLYAVGVILYEMVTGRPPFEADDPATLLLHADQPPPLPSEHRPGLDPMVQTIILRLLAKNLDERYQDAYHLIDDCKAVLSRVISPQGSSSPPTVHSHTAQRLADGDQNMVSKWALCATVLGRMVATCYPGGNGPPTVTQSIDEMWRLVAELTRTEGELQATQTWDDNLRQRGREFVIHVGRQIEDLSRTRSSLRREITTGRKELHRRRGACDRSWRELNTLRLEIEKAESCGNQEQLWALLRAAGAAAAREQAHLDAIALVEQKIEKWQRAVNQVETQTESLRRQIERHSEQVEKDLDLGKPRFTAQLEERSRTTLTLRRATSVLAEHFRSRPECAALFQELGTISASTGGEQDIFGEAM